MISPGYDDASAVLPMEISTDFSVSNLPSFGPFSSPDPPPRPSLKRSRSSPILSPPPSSNPNPFILPKAPLKLALPPPFAPDDPTKKDFSNSFALLDPPILSGDPPSSF